MREDLSLSKAAQYLLEESRMVLPGMQALFGFQMIAVFNNSFAQKLTVAEQHLHLVAIGLVATAIAVIMTPAAYHRQMGARQVTDRFVRISTRLLLTSMVPLAISICIDFYLVGRIVAGRGWVASVAIVLFVLFLCLWFVLPRSRALQDLLVGARGGPAGALPERISS